MADCQKAASEFVSSPFIGAMKSYGLSEEQLSDARRLAPYSKADEYLYEGVPELLRLLAKTHSLGIIANQSAGTLNRLKDWGIRQYFSSVFASAEAGLSKPDPEIFNRALNEAGCSPNEAMIVGDRLDNDIGPATLAGWRTARVLQGFSRVQKARSDYEQPLITVSSIVQIHSRICAFDQ